MRLKSRLFILNLLLLINVADLNAQDFFVKKEMFQWGMLPPVPDSIGFAGSFGGTADDVLIVAGGSNFPNGGTPWNGGTKTWYDKIFVLEKPGSQWKEAGKLPFPLGYGVSVSTKYGLILIGGSNGKGHVSNVFLLQYRNGKIEIEELPSLPFPLANSCGALIGEKIFIAGGLRTPSSPSESKFLCFDLRQREGSWKELDSWPGPSRMMAVAGSDGNNFYLFSGAELADGNRAYLKDAYSFSEQGGWKKLADLPWPVTAAPSLAFYSPGQGMFIFGGDAGTYSAAAATLKEKHPGFNDKILQYDMLRNSWSSPGEMYTHKKNDLAEKPNNSVWAPVTTSLVIWKNMIVFPGGEVRPGTRTPNVIIAKPCQK